MNAQPQAAHPKRHTTQHRMSAVLGRTRKWPALPCGGVPGTCAAQRAVPVLLLGDNEIFHWCNNTPLVSQDLVSAFPRRFLNDTPFRASVDTATPNAGCRQLRGLGWISFVPFSSFRAGGLHSDSLRKCTMAQQLFLGRGSAGPNAGVPIRAPERMTGFTTRCRTPYARPFFFLCHARANWCILSGHRTFLLKCI